MSGDNKRSNFIHSEKELLIDLVEKYRGVIENKKTDATTCKQKEEAWASVATDFNGQSAAGVKRTSQQLLNAYKNLKRVAKKKLSDDKACIYLFTKCMLQSILMNR